jgi:uncharacterized membrane protein YkoI
MASVLLILAAAVQAKEEKVALDKVPKPVMDAVKARFKDASVIGADQETEDGKLAYEVSVKDKAQSVDVTLTPEGEILSLEKGIAAKALPQAVAKALEDKYLKATLKGAEEITELEKGKEKPAYYEVRLVTADKKKLEVEVSAEGKILNEEEKKSDKDDE